MALSRPFVLALIGAVLVAATFVATRPSDEGSSSAPAPAEQQAAKPAPAQKPEAKKAAAEDKAAAKARAEKAEQQAAAKQAEAKAAAEQREIDAIVKKLPAVAPGADPGDSVGMPISVARALARDKTVVIFFSQGGSDDVATSNSVRSLRGNRRVAVFSEDLDEIPNYRRIVAGLGVSEAPSIVIVGRDLKARLLEGYHDSGSLRQHVRDVG